MPGRWSKLDAGLAAVMLGVGWLLGFGSPSTLAGAAAWSLAVLGVLFGLGMPIRRILGVELGIGEQLVLGGIAWIAITGPLIALGVCSRPTMIVLAALGSAAAVVDAGARPLLPRRRPETAVLVLALGLAVLLAVQLLGAIATRGNPFDDQIGYTALVKRLLDCGDLVEPFSFRRVSAYGGHTSLLALAALRGDVESTDLLDRGIFQAIAVLVVLDVARRRKLHLGATALVIAFTLGVWDMSINSAATWTGFAMFAAAYGFASREDIPARNALLLAFVACAGACTLRQNYLVPAGLYAALMLTFHVRAEAAKTSWGNALRAERRTIALCIGAAAAIVLPYLVAAVISNRTFLYPLQLGTVSPDAPLRPTGATVMDEVAFFLTTSIYADPIRVWWLLLPLMILARDRRPTRPWHAFLIACVFGFVFLIHSFMLSDAGTLWRYAYGYATPLAVMFLVEVGAYVPGVQADEDHRPLRLGAVGSFLAWLALLVQLVFGSKAAADRVDVTAHNVKAAIALGTNKSADAALYHELQASIPAGARVAVMIDDPYLLDFARNQIFNLDLPGFASPAPGLPSYLGPERWRTYFLALDIRYVAYVNTAYSTYLYRRTSWINRMFAEGEIWRFIGARYVDASDTLVALSKTSTVLFDRDGLVVIDLGTASQPAPNTPDPPEALRRDRFARDISERELGNKAWQLASRSDVVFLPDGLGPSQLQMLDPIRGLHTVVDGALELLTTKGSVVAPFRWLSDRTHVRVHGAGKRRFRITIRADIDRLLTIPSLRVVLDGTELARVRAAPDGQIEVAGEATCNGWCDMYLVLSSVSEYWVPPEYSRAVKLLGFEWEEAGT